MRLQKKLAALSLLLVHAITVFYPGTSYALTSGPSQPESTQFSPATISNLVNPSSGDFNYNIPLMDVDGYPVNLAYSTGGGMDDEASWVGFGWTLNPGSVSRVMKGIPDDFNGTDKIKKEYNLRPDVTGGVSFNVSTEIFGTNFTKGNVSADIFYNNKRGLGVELGIGISAPLNTAKHVSGEYTSGLAAGGKLGITSNSQTGANFNFGINMGIETKDKENNAGALGYRFGGGLNSRAGLKSTTLGVSFNSSKKEASVDDWNKFLVARAMEEKVNVPLYVSYSKELGGYSGSVTSYYGQAFTPTITMPMQNESYSLSPQFGPEFWGAQGPILQLTGHFTKQKLASSMLEFPAYGFLHSAKGRTDPHAILDFNREKDVPYMESTPTLSVPYVTQDIFTATSQFGSSQFKAVSNGSGVFFDPLAINVSTAFSLGAEFGAGWGIKGGVDLSSSGSFTTSKKWVNNNDFLHNGDFLNAEGIDGENTFFKMVGELSSANKDYLNKVIDRTPVKIRTDDVDDQAKAFSTFVNGDNNYPISSKIARGQREPRSELFSTLTAVEASKFALDKRIKSYSQNTNQSILYCRNGQFGNFTQINRVSPSRKSHHLSELSVTKTSGLKLVYGIPVYNNEQCDVTFSVANSKGANNFVQYSNTENSTSNKSGNDFYFSKETIPAYATSYLLSGITSTDYKDLTGNGISDDDLGTAIKFNYSLINPAYKWRTPTGSAGVTNYANFSEGHKSQTNDNKASLSYGNKELWYTHSIESKNMIAVFRLGDRNDGYGYNPNGSIDNNSKSKKLERIDLYTKAELLNNPTNPTPIKSVHLEYDYSLFGNTPNNITNGGKLTLKKVYFTYADSKSGEDNAYKFTYNPSGDFEYQQYDRWGNYKNKNLNNSIAGVDLDNNDYPYSIQNKVEADQAVVKWQLSEIELPSGGKIKVEYESDDYAYVQNKRAMEMAKIVGYGTLNNYTEYQKTNKIFIQLPEPSTNQKVKADYFDDVTQLYFKTMVNLDNNGSNELVSGYAGIEDVTITGPNNDIAEVTLTKRGGYHPMAAASWQYLRTELSQLAYPYSVNDQLDPLAFVKALIGAIRNVSELLTPFEQRAMRQKYAESIIPGKGFARIINKYQKFGGGIRVKKILMDDNWSTMAGSGNGNTTTTGMQFLYTKKFITKNNEELTISSGVASYEPMPGGEENPFRQPISYQQRVHLNSNIFTVEEPLGESYFPAPSVCYSEVTIKNLDAEGNVANNGYSINKFYTAKDFPTIVKRTDLSSNKYNQTSIFGLFNIDQGNSVVLSQGFYVENNDMHGKSLSEETFDGSSKMIAGTYYHYKTSGTETLSLDNNALTLQPDGTVKNEIIGQEVEMFHDMREQVTENSGINLNINLDVLFFFFVTVPIPTFIPIMQNTYCGYQSASTIKVVNRYSIADKVTVIENGSTMVNENILWDGVTGQVLLTKTQNGFDDPLYNFSLPAYLVSDYEKGMGAAYKNHHILFNNITISNGAIPSNTTPYLVPGDELGNYDNGDLFWVLEQANNTLKLINKKGEIVNGTYNLFLLKSGRQNLTSSSTYSVISLKNPIKNGKIEIDQNTEVLNTNATVFADEWAVTETALPCESDNGGIILPEGKANTNKVNKSFTEIIKEQNARQQKSKSLKTPDKIRQEKIKAIYESAKKNNFKDAKPLSEIINKTPKVYSRSGPCMNPGDFIIDYFNCGPYAHGVNVIAPINFPSDQSITFIFRSACSDGFSELKSITIDPNNLQGTFCFNDGDSHNCTITLVNSFCEDFEQPNPNSFCPDASMFDVGYKISPYGMGAAFVEYTGSTPIPLGVNVYVTLEKAKCSGPGSIFETVIINTNFQENFAYSFYELGCFNAATISNINCETIVCGDVCSDLSNYQLSQVEYDYGSIIQVQYVCPYPFPTDKIINFKINRNCETPQSLLSMDISRNQLTNVFYTGGVAPTLCVNTEIEDWGCAPATATCCILPINKVVNPYMIGLKGNWRGKQSYVYSTNREARVDPNNLATQPTNLRKGGILSTYAPFYKIVGGKFVPNYSLDDKWIASNTITKINSKGQEIENKDALNKYASVQFGFNELLATAVASNAKNHELAYDGFEDYNFNTSCIVLPILPVFWNCAEKGHFNFHQGLFASPNNKKTIVNTEAHTGNYSVRIAGGNAEVKTTRDATLGIPESPLYSFNSNGEMLLQPAGVIPPFKPLLGKKYILSGWIKGDVLTENDDPYTNKAKLIIQSGGYYAAAVKAGPKVEGWTRVMTVFELPTSLSTNNEDVPFDIIMAAGDGIAYFDDIRIHPYDGNMKSFAYDYKTTRLMAELDENNYATFFEYDDEGQLLRKKKETEKGIVTLQESRSRVKKNN